MASPLSDLQRALGSLAILPDIGRHITRMAKDVHAMREGVQELPPELRQLRLEVERLHADMKQMVDDVAELRSLETKLDEVSESLGRIPFVRRRGQPAPAPATEPPEAA